jgi:catechol 2,3-dioxygenase-like lactoylglutathione lyase family enzyme
MNGLENLRKRAKHLVREHRAGSYLVPERIRRSLARFQALTDREVLAAPFGLHDAHQLLAEERGFRTWAELKEAVSVSPSTPTPTEEVRLERILPQVFVRDIERSSRWYRDVLGFTVIFTYGSPPFYAEVRRGDAALNLRYTDQSPWDEGLRSEEELLVACIATTDAKALYLELRDKGAEIATPLGSPAYGGQQFVVRDPDQNLILFGSGGCMERSDRVMQSAAAG